MRNGSIQKTILLLLKLFQELNVRVPLEKVEQIAIMVHKAMTIKARNYHSLDHVFSLTEGLNPLQDLSAVFHDIVYYQVDQFLIPEINTLLSPYIEIINETHSLIKAVHFEDRILDITLGVFGFKRGQEVTPLDGANEFLSALVMNKSLEGIVSEENILLSTTCIEATIPFRKNSIPTSHPMIMENRLLKIRNELSLDLQDEQIYDGIIKAVSLANRDVGGFCVPDPGLFLNDTWKLLPESNVSLRIKEYYSIKEYRIALQKMEAFFRSVKSENVYQCYREEPSEEKLAEMIKYAKNNIDTGRDYIGVKLVGIAVIEAFAELSGGDAPVSLFMGDIDEKENETRMEDYLPEVEITSWSDHNPTVYNLLEYGRSAPSNFDMNNSPLSSYIYKKLGQTRLEALLKAAKEMFNGTISYAEFLKQVDADIVSTLVKACSALAITRSTKINSLLR